MGEELKEKGYGGIYNVGKGAEEPPRLVILTYEPPAEVLSEEDKDTSAITLVGKGIVYDTGGLAIKSRPGMCGMKHDMGGSAGVLGGFMAAVKMRTPRKIRLLLCLVSEMHCSLLDERGAANAMMLTFCKLNLSHSIS